MPGGRPRLHHDTLWSGDLKDHVVLPESEIVTMAEAYFTPQAIVVGHLNHPPVTKVYTGNWSTSSARASFARPRSMTCSDDPCRTKIKTTSAT